MQEDGGGGDRHNMSTNYDGKHVHPDFCGTSEHVANSLADLAKNIPGGDKSKTHKKEGRFMKKAKKSADHHLKESRPAGVHTAIITKESASENVSRQSVDDVTPTEEYTNFYAYVLGNPNKVYAQFLQAHKSYDVIPVNTKFVVLDTGLPVRKAFYALIYNGVRSALLWNGKKLCGMLTVTDFIHILVRTYNNSVDKTVKNIDNHLIKEWREMLKQEGKLKKLSSVNGNESLLKAVQLLIDTKYHRVPILDEFDDNPLYFLTHKRILRFIYLFIDELPTPPFMHKSIRELGVGTYNDVLTVHPETPLITCLSRLISRSLSALPVITKDGIVIDIYARFDAIAIAADGTFDCLDRPVGELLERRKNSKWYKGVVTCRETDRLRTVMDILVQSEVHGVVIVDELNKLRGVVTLYDVLKYIVIHPVISDVLEEDSAALRTAL